ncbi:hypothetical protein T459_25622 [Capsicum annuum]|uniref:Serine-threonine/tyrosine-protein kinase catalytic domain-containing protein n=1 Tax=Capsicum annuum TaxID=4072 RepID=A0A2G2YL97_CAPAN|nr:hypothetical protein T459_25622 [Capsicum annuum]
MHKYFLGQSGVEQEYPDRSIPCFQAIDPALDVKQESTLDSIYTVAELAGHCTAREPAQWPDMSHVVNMFAPLVEKWNPLEEDTDGECGIDYSHSTK